MKHSVFICVIYLLIFRVGKSFEIDQSATELGLIRKYINFSVDPCEDFYEYACGNWKLVHPRPKHALEHSALLRLSTKVWYTLKDILESPYSDGFAFSNAELKAKAFYKGCIRVQNLQEESNKHYNRLLKSLGGWPVLDPDWNANDFNWLNISARIRLYGASGLIQEGVGLSQQDSSNFHLVIAETDFAIVRRNDLLNPSQESLLPSYRALVIETMSRLGAEEENARHAAEEIIAFETELAKITVDPVEKVTDVISFQVLKQKLPAIDWENFFAIIMGSPLPDGMTVSLTDEKYFVKLTNLISFTDRRILANYLLWKFALTSVNDFLNVPRWRLCLDQTMYALGPAVSATYVRKYFDVSIRKDVLQIISHLQDSFRENLGRNTWLDARTKMEAETKLDSISALIGYPDYILSPQILDTEYEELRVDPGSYFSNVLNARKFMMKQSHLVLRGKNLKDRWPIQPADVNGFYNVRKNTIVITAGILQPPIYSKYFPKAITYGTFGSFVGHELTHGFDKDGRNYDTDGNLRNWWSQSAKQQFNSEVGCFVSQYNNYKVPELELSSNGQQTLSENIADNGGLRHAYQAYQNWLKIAGHEKLDNERILGLNLTNLQLFFVGFAHFHCGEVTPMGALTLMSTDTHSLPKHRVDGSVSNFEKFSEVFKCPVGTPMNPPKKCKIW